MISISSSILRILLIVFGSVSLILMGILWEMSKIAYKDSYIITVKFNTKEKAEDFTKLIKKEGVYEIEQFIECPFVSSNCEYRVGVELSGEDKEEGAIELVNRLSAQKFEGHIEEVTATDSLFVWVGDEFKDLEKARVLKNTLQKYGFNFSIKKVENASLSSHPSYNVAFKILNRDKYIKLKQELKASGYEVE